MKRSLRIAFFGPSLVSEFWNGSAAYFRGIAEALAERGHRITFYEPEACDGRRNRDMADPDWAEIVVYRGNSSWAAARTVEQARGFDLVVKISGIGACDDILEAAVLELKSPRTLVAFWDVDAPVTLDRLASSLIDPFRRLIPRFDLILTHGGGEPVVSAYESLGARAVSAIYNAFDPAVHFPVQPDPRLAAELGFVGDNLPDRENRVEEFFLKPARLLPERSFVLGGAGWADAAIPDNIGYLGHIAHRNLNAFNSSSTAILSINRESTVRYGFSPPTRLFEAAGVGACVISDVWAGLDLFLEPGQEVLLAHDAGDVIEHVRSLDRRTAAKIGAAARRRMLNGHTYAHRATQLEALLEGVEATSIRPLTEMSA